MFISDSCKILCVAFVNETYSEVFASLFEKHNEHIGCTHTKFI